MSPVENYAGNSLAPKRHAVGKALHVYCRADTPVAIGQKLGAETRFHAIGKSAGFKAEHREYFDIVRIGNALQSAEDVAARKRRRFKDKN